MKFKICLAIVLSISLVLVGCGESGSTPTPTQTPEPMTSPTAEVISPAIIPTPIETEEITEGQPAQFELDSLSLVPDSVTVEETAEISVNVTNVGDVDGTYATILTADSEPVDSKELDVAAGSTHEVTFTYKTATPGTLTIGVGELTAELEVQEAVLSGPAEINVSNNQTIINFPDTVGFTLEGTSALPVTKISLEYGTDKRTLVNEISRVEPEYATGSDVSASWVWLMKETFGSVPPGAKIWWRWRITDENDRMYTTPRQTVVYEDTRFNWKVESREDMDLYYHDRDSSFGKELTDGIEEKLARIELEAEIPEDRKIKILIYADNDEFQSAILFAPDWAGGLAFTQYNIIVYGIRPDQFEWGKRTLAHEITHVLVEEATFGPFGDVPTWLNEGLAMHSEGEMTEYHKGILESAIANDELRSVQSISSSFPADPDMATLAYVQSSSLVSYLLDTYGWEKMRELLEVFKEGSTYDSGLNQVYSFDINGLEEEWLTYIGAI
ncbi:MAG: hypothetical protein GY845_02155 [Planctomycetes bacterium]|nr:hypothetical protein [Planctomycetota bacterium]